MTVKGKYGGRKVRDGTVVSDKMQKTVLVAVEEHVRHRLYKKRVRRLHRFMAHDEREDSKMGDRVRIVEAAPLSRRKRWQVVEILQRAELPEVAAGSIDLDLLGEVKREEGAAPVAKPVGDGEEVAAKAEPVAAAEESALEPEEAVEEVSVEEAVAEPEPEAVAEPEPEAAAEPEPEAAAEPEPEAAAEPEPEAIAEPEPEAVAEPEPEAAAEPEPEAAAEPEPEAVAESEPEAVAEPEPEAAAEPEPEAAAEGEEKAE